MFIGISRALYKKYKEGDAGNHIGFFIQGYGSTDYLTRHTRNFLLSQSTERQLPKRDLEQHIDCHDRYRKIFPGYRLGEMAYSLLNPSTSYLRSLTLEDLDKTPLGEAAHYERRTITNLLTEKAVYLVLNKANKILKNNFKKKGFKSKTN